MSHTSIAFALYLSVGAIFLLAFLGGGRPNGKRQTVAVIASAVLWPIAITAALSIAIHAAIQEQVAERRK